MYNHPAIPLPGIYLGKTIITKDTCIPVFIVALFTIARRWKKPKCPSTDEKHEENVVHTYNGMLLSHDQE